MGNGGGTRSRSADEKIENFRAHVFDRAKAVLGAGARTEKFTTSIMDGIDIATPPHWYDGEIYVKVMPPSAEFDCVVMLFDTPADPRTIRGGAPGTRSTTRIDARLLRQRFFQGDDWPGIALSTYVRSDVPVPAGAHPGYLARQRADFTETLEERLWRLAACIASATRRFGQSPASGTGLRKLAKRFGRSSCISG